MDSAATYARSEVECSHMEIEGSNSFLAAPAQLYAWHAQGRDSESSSRICQAPERSRPITSV